MKGTRKPSKKRSVRSGSASARTIAMEMTIGELRRRGSLELPCANVPGRPKAATAGGPRSGSRSPGSSGRNSLP
eukprot:4029189-Alexandrium_andersonii.AAC.1